MKKIIAALAILVGFQTQAGIISVQVDPSVSLGNTVEVTILGSAFDAFDTLSFELEFDTSVFTYDDTSLTGALLDASDFFYDVTEEFYGMAFYFLNDALIPSGDLILAKFNLLSVSQGSTDFSVVNIFAENFLDGLPVTADAGPTASAEVTNAVPVPATLGLFAVALLGFVRLRRKA